MTSMLREILDTLRGIENAHNRIANAIEEAVSQTRPGDIETQVMVNESLGECPSCESIRVQQQGNYPKVIFKCLECQQVWVTDEKHWFST